MFPEPEPNPELATPASFDGLPPFGLNRISPEFGLTGTMGSQGTQVSRRG